MAKKTAITPSFHLVENFTAEKIAFQFSFSNQGSYDAWIVESNGIERAHGNPSGEFGGVISPGAVLLVRFKVVNGSYKITYKCKAGTASKTDPNTPSPIQGVATGPAAAVHEVRIQF